MGQYVKGRMQGYCSKHGAATQKGSNYCCHVIYTSKSWLRRLQHKPSRLVHASSTPQDTQTGSCLQRQRQFMQKQSFRDLKQHLQTSDTSASRQQLEMQGVVIWDTEPPSRCMMLSLPGVYIPSAKASGLNTQLRSTQLTTTRVSTAIPCAKNQRSITTPDQSILLKHQHPSPSHYLV